MRLLILVLVFLYSCSKETVEKEQKEVRLDYRVWCFSDTSIIQFTDYKDGQYTSSSETYTGHYWTHVTMFPANKFQYQLTTHVQGQDSIYQEIRINDTLRKSASGHSILSTIIQF